MQQDDGAPAPSPVVRMALAPFASQRSLLGWNLGLLPQQQGSALR